MFVPYCWISLSFTVLLNIECLYRNVEYHFLLPYCWILKACTVLLNITFFYHTVEYWLLVSYCSKLISCTRLFNIYFFFLYHTFTYWFLVPYCWIYQTIMEIPVHDVVNTEEETFRASSGSSQKVKCNLLINQTTNLLLNLIFTIYSSVIKYKTLINIQICK